MTQTLPPAIGQLYDPTRPAEIDELYRRWPKTGDMVSGRAIATCRGGAQ